MFSLKIPLSIVEVYLNNKIKLRLPIKNLVFNTAAVSQCNLQLCNSPWWNTIFLCFLLGRDHAILNRVLTLSRSYHITESTNPSAIHPTPYFWSNPCWPALLRICPFWGCWDQPYCAKWSWFYAKEVLVPDV